MDKKELRDGCMNSSKDAKRDSQCTWQLKILSAQALTGFNILQKRPEQLPRFAAEASVQLLPIADGKKKAMFFQVKPLGPKNIFLKAENVSKSINVVPMIWAFFVSVSYLLICPQSPLMSSLM